MADNALLDRGVIQQLADDMGLSTQDVIPDLVDSLETDANRAMTDMREALATGDAERLRRAAHKLKGSCATLGATTAATLARELEHEVQTGGLEYVASKVDTLNEVCVRSIEELRRLSS